MKIIRVFPKRTSYTPADDYVFIGMPPMKPFIPEHDEVHISCTFTWDKEYCEELPLVAHRRISRRGYT